MSQKKERAALTLEEAAVRRKCSLNTIRDRINRGLLHTHTSEEGRTLVWADEVDALEPIPMGRPAMIGRKKED